MNARWRNAAIIVSIAALFLGEAHLIPPAAVWVGGIMIGLATFWCRKIGSDPWSE